MTNELTKRGVIEELERDGWKWSRVGWKPPIKARVPKHFERLTLREAASLAGISSRENLGK